MSTAQNLQEVQVFSGLRDNVSGKYMQYFLSPSRLEARRSFLHWVRTQDSPVRTFPEAYELVIISSVDYDGTARVVQSVIVSADEIKELFSNN